MRYFPFLGFCLFPILSVLNAQQVLTGRITAASDDSPISGVSIFVANTTIGTTSDESGNYKLNIPGKGGLEIVVSHVSFQPVFHQIDTPKSFHRLDIILEVREIQEVIITASNSCHTQDDIDLFWRILLGELPSKRGLEILNPEKIYFYRNSDDVLTVSCNEFIEIINHEMGYHIRYVLKSFKHDYRNKEALHYGKPYFEELTPGSDRQNYRWEKKRQEIYAVSLIRFIRALYQKQLHEEGFLLANRDSLSKAKTSSVLPEDILQADWDHILVNIEEPLFLICYSKPVTAQMIKNSHRIIYSRNETHPVMKLMPQQFAIFPDGTYTGILKTQRIENKVLGLSFKSITGLSFMLPVEYASTFSATVHREDSED